jgi:hypothetical protein
MILYPAAAARRRYATNVHAIDWPETADSVWDVREKRMTGCDSTETVL